VDRPTSRKFLVVFEAYRKRVRQVRRSGTPGAYTATVTRWYVLLLWGDGTRTCVSVPFSVVRWLRKEGLERTVSR
jgi:hypothetical protein